MTLLQLPLVVLLSALVQDSESKRNHNALSATVNGWVITATRVDRFIEDKMIGRTLGPEVRQRLHQEALEHLVRRQIVLEYLKTTRFFRLNRNAVDKRIEGLRQELRKLGRTLKEHLAERQISQREFENEISWEIVWGNFLKSHLSDERLEEFYNERRREFDGTRLKVAHLLLRPIGEEASQEVVNRAMALRQQIVLGSTTWGKAVRDFSVAETSVDKQGLLGWIEFSGPMPDEFNRLAFQLDPGQTSLPVKTGIGVHLIRCLEVEPGNRGPKDVDASLRMAAKRWIFDQLADQKRSNVEIQYAYPNEH